MSDGKKPRGELRSGRRRILVTATSAVGAAGLAAASVPFIESMNPSGRARAAGAPVDAEFSALKEGELAAFEWRGKPVWVVRRTEAMLKALTEPAHDARLLDPRSEVASQQPVYCQNQYRSIKPPYFVVVAICTHLGCVPTYRPTFAPPDLGPSWDGGFFCPCHGSRYDLAGRVYRNVPAPLNLVIPPHHYIDDTRVRIGEDPGKTRS